jgi:transketolase
MQEGSNWEALQFAVKHKLSNLTLVIDNNRLQAMDFLENVLTPRNRKNDLNIKCRAFGLKTDRCDGHNINKIVKILRKWTTTGQKLEKPQALIAQTIKGYGLLCMEDVPKFHFRLPTEEELRQGCRYE